MEELKNKENLAALIWELKLCHREMKFSENQKTMEDYEKAMTHNIKKYNQMMQTKWDKIDHEIQMKKKERLRSRNKNNKNSRINIVTATCKEPTNISDVSVLTHAKDILTRILNKASEDVKIKSKDFSKDPAVFSHVCNEIKLVFDDVEDHVFNDVRKIINASKHSRETLLEVTDNDSKVRFSR